MHIILLFLSAIGSILWIMYLWKNVGGKTPSCFRLKNKWQKQAGADPLESITDPRDAAVLLMLGMAECEGVISSGQKEAVQENCKKYFDADDKAAEDYYVANSFLLKRTASLEKLTATLLPLMERELGEKEKRELLEMMRTVATTDKVGLNEDQSQMLQMVAAKLGVAIEL